MREYSKEKVLELLTKGSLDEEINLDKSLDLLSFFAEKDPKTLLDAIYDVAECRIDGMILVALSILAGKATDEFLDHKQNKASMVEILAIFGPPKLLEFTRMMKSRAFGRGLGARPQKLVRRVMETWGLKVMEKYIANHPDSYQTLIKVVHPRYQGERGKLVKDFLIEKIIQDNNLLDMH